MTISTASSQSTSANADNGSGGLVAVGRANTKSTLNNTSQAYVDTTAAITAGGNFTLTTSSTNDMGTVVAKAVAGGFAADVRADVIADLDYANKAEVRQGASVIVGGAVVVSSTTGSSGSSSATGDGRGFGGGGYANQDGIGSEDSGINGFRVGKRQGTALTQTAVGNDAVVTGQTVALSANTTALKVHSTASSTAGGFVAISHSDGRLGIDAQTNVNVNSNSLVTGRSGVDLLAHADHVNDDVTNPAYASAEAIGAFGDVSATGTNDTTFRTQVTASAGAPITAGPRNNAHTTLATPAGFTRLGLYVDASNGTVNTAKDASVTKKAAATGSSHTGGTASVTKNIASDANVTLLSGPSPTLLIDAAGNITASNASATVSGNTIVVADIVNNGPGQAYLNSDTITGTVSTGAGRSRTASPTCASSTARRRTCRSARSRPSTATPRRCRASSSTAPSRAWRSTWSATPGRRSSTSRT